MGLPQIGVADLALEVRLPAMLHNLEDEGCHEGRVDGDLGVKEGNVAAVIKMGMGQENAIETRSGRVRLCAPWLPETTARCRILTVDAFQRWQ